MGDASTVKVTYSLPADLVERVRSVVSDGAAPSYSAFVERALEEAVRQERERRLAEALGDAARDPLFLADIGEVDRDFEHADRDVESGDDG